MKILIVHNKYINAGRGSGEEVMLECNFSGAQRQRPPPNALLPFQFAK